MVYRMFDWLLGFRQGASGDGKRRQTDTILGWYRKLIARKFDGSKARPYPGRTRVDENIEQLVVRMAKENSGWALV